MTTRRQQPGSVAGAPAGIAPGPAIPVTAARRVRVVLGWQLANGVLRVIATTAKRGASYHDSWSMTPSLALVLVTVLDTSSPRRPSYVSRATVGASSLEPDTTYSFSYSIVMRAGGSAWVGSGSIAVTVDPDGSLAETPWPSMRAACGPSCASSSRATRAGQIRRATCS